MDKFLTSNSTGMRLARTIVQAILGVLIANADMLLGQTTLSPEMRAMTVALVMAILSPIMAEIGKHIEPTETVETEE